MTSVASPGDHSPLLNGTLHTKAHHYTPTSPATKKGTRCPFFMLLKKIWHAVSCIFSKIASLFKSSPLKLSERELEVIKGAGKKPLTVHKPASQSEALTLRSIKPIDTSTVSSLGSTSENDIPLPPIEDPDMQAFHDVAQEFVSIATDCIFEEKIAPTLKNVKEGVTKASEMLKMGADIAISVGDKAAKPFFDKLKEFNVKEKMQPHLKQLVVWLTPKEIKTDLKAVLLKRLKTEFPDKEEAYLKELINPCLAWLKSDHEKTLSEFYLGRDEAEIEIVFQTAMNILVEKKIEEYMQLYHEKISEQLPQLLHQTMKKNGEKMTGILIRRFIDLLQSAEWAGTYDKLIGLGFDQTSAIVKLEEVRAQVRKDELAMIAKAKLAQKTAPKTKQERLAKEKLEEYLEQVQKVGEESWISQKVEEAANQAFSKMPICHKAIGELINNPNLSEKEKLQIKEKLFEDFSENLLEIMLPKKTVILPSGEEKQIDGLVYMLNQIILPKEFVELKDEAVKISQEIISPENLQILKSATDAVWEIAYDKVEEIVLGEVKKTLRKGLVTGMGKLFEGFINPKLINEMMAYEAFPAVQRQILKAMGKQILSNNLNGFLEDFDQLTTLFEDNKKGRDKVSRKIIKDIYDVSQKACQEFQKEFKKIPYEEYVELMLPVIQEIEAGIRAYQKEKDSYSKECVALALQGYFQERSHGNNPLYGDIAVNLAFKIGKLSSTAEWFSDFFKGMIGAELTTALHPMRKSPHFLIKLATAEIQDRYLEKAKVKELLFGESEDHAIEETNEALKTEIENTAKIAHDLIFKAVSYQSGAWYKKPIVKSVIGSNANHLTTVISRIYHQLLGNRLLTHNLLVRAQNLAMDALVKSAETIDAAEGANIILAKRVPTLIPNCLLA